MHLENLSALSSALPPALDEPDEDPGDADEELPHPARASPARTTPSSAVRKNGARWARRLVEWVRVCVMEGLLRWGNL
jgi:hypothetical protein